MEITYSNLSHSGLKGMKWGVRRYQNADGSLTEAGKKRYARDAREKEFSKYDETTGKYFKASKNNRRTDLEVDANRYVKEDLQRTKSLTEASSRMTGDLKRVTEKSIKNTPKKTMDLSHMSDKEMRDQINRAFLEKQYNDMFAPQTSSKGKEMVQKSLDAAGDVLAVTASALSIALAIKELKGK